MTHVKASCWSARFTGGTVALVLVLTATILLRSALAQGPKASTDGLVPVAKAMSQISQHKDLITDRGNKWKALYESHFGFAVSCKQTLTKAIQNRGGGSGAIGYIDSAWAKEVCASADSVYSGFYGGPAEVLATSLTAVKDHAFVTASDLDQLDKKIQEWKQQEQELNTLMIRLVGHTADHAVCYETHASDDPLCVSSSQGIDADLTALEKFKKYSFLAAISGKDVTTYKIEQLSLEDHDTDSLKALQNSKVDSARSVIDERQKELDRVRKVFVGDENGKGVGDLAFSAANVQNQRGQELAVALEQLDNVRNLLEDQPYLHSDNSTNLQNTLNERQKAVALGQLNFANARQDATAARERATESKNEIVRAAQALADAKVALAKTIETRASLELLSSLQEVQVTADGHLALVAKFSETLAQQIQDLEKFNNQIASDVAKSSQMRDDAEKTLMAFQEDTQKQLDDLDSAIKSRGGAKMFSTAFKGTAAALEGGMEGGYEGAFMEVLKFAEEEEIAKAFENEKDIRDEIETALGKESEAPAATEPTIRAKLLNWTAEKAVGGGAGLGTEWGMKAAEKLGEALLEPTQDVLKEIFSGHTGLESSPTWPILQKSLEEINHMDSAVDKLRALPSISERALKPAERTSLLVRVKKAAIDKAAQKTSNENLVKMALKFVTDKSIESLEDFFKKEEATAWANYILADRAERAQRVVFVEASETYWAQKKFYGSLLDMENKFMEQAGDSGKFKIVSSIPFSDGAKISVRTVPGLQNFTHLSGYLGGQQLIPTSGATLTGEANGLDHRTGTNPRQVTLILAVGK